MNLREFSVLPVHNERTTYLTSGLGNHDDNKSLWIVGRWELMSGECTLVRGIILLLSKLYV